MNRWLALAGMIALAVLVLRFYPLLPNGKKNAQSSAAHSYPRPSPVASAPPMSPARPLLPGDPPSPRSLNPEEIQRIRANIQAAMSEIYSAEKSFYSEYQRYSTDLNALAFAPEKSFRAKFGFLRPYSPESLWEGEKESEDPRYLDSDYFTKDESYPPEKRPIYMGRSWQVNLAEHARFCRQGCTASTEGFEMIAVAQLVDGYPPDVWTINEKRELRHAQDGTKP